MKQEAGARVMPFTEVDRGWAIDALYDISDEFFEEVDLLEQEFGAEDVQLWHGEVAMEARDGVFFGWAWFDQPLSDGLTLAQRLMKLYEIPAGVRRYLELMSDTVTKLYEVVEARPGISIRLRSMLEGTEITVREQSFSRTATRGMLIAARIIGAGKSGEPEIESGVLQIPELQRGQLLEELRDWQRRFRKERPGATSQEFWKLTPPYFFEVWFNAFSGAALPDIALPNGELALPTRVTFEVTGEPARICERLGALERLQPGMRENEWHLLEEELPIPAEIMLEGDRLTLRTISAEQAERAREVLEASLAGLIVHRSTTHESILAAMEDAKSKIVGVPAGEGDDGLDPDVQELLALDHFDRHYTEWVDVPVPALDGQTPRAAAKSEAMKGRVAELIRGLEGMYERDLRAGRPAYDPSWMWAELGLLEEDEPSLPPPLAHERWEARFQWEEEFEPAIAQVRAHPHFDERTVIGEDYLRADLGTHRLVRELDDDGRKEALLRVVPCVMNHELHRRRTFWVSEALVFMLANTDPYLEGLEERLPSPSSAFVFTDRYTLSRGERLLARTGSPLGGYILRVLTVYVREDSGAVTLDFAFDALGDDVPWIVSHRLERADGEMTLPPRPEPLVMERGGEEFVLERVAPLADLVRLVVNAVLYATSAGAEPELREPTRGKGKRARGGETDGFTKDAVHYLPSTVTTSGNRRLEALRRKSLGASILQRFTVRGRWRRPNPSWKDQRLRWIEPYWNGPDPARLGDPAA